MNKILENIATQIGAAHLIVNQNALTRENCRADLTGLPTNRVVVDMDAVYPSGQQGKKQCDYVIFFMNTSEDTCVAVPIELKSRDIKKAKEQLQQGANFANRYVPAGCKTICVPVLFHKGLSKIAHRALQRRKVRFRGTRMTVEPTRCGAKRNLAAKLPPSIVLSRGMDFRSF